MFIRKLKYFADPVIAITVTFTLIVLGPVIGLLLTLFLIITALWPLMILYLIWIYIDRKTCDQGSRPVNFVRRSTWFKNVVTYFPVKTIKQDGFDLDPKRNYLFCYFPHGIIPIGLSCSMTSDLLGCKLLFPNHIPHMIMIKLNFFLPFVREVFFSNGCCSPSKESLNWILSHRNGGRIAGLSVGGGEEAFECVPGKHVIVLKNRKGFVKIAIRNGAPLVPVYSFGETDCFEVIKFDRTSFIRKIQTWLYKKTGIAFMLFKGRSFGYVSIPFIPRQKPVHVIIGKPIEVIKNANPTQEDIDDIHNKFMVELESLFESEKHKYLKNPNQVKLVIK